VSVRRIAYESRVFLLTLGAGAPGIAVAIGFLWTSDNRTDLFKWLTTALVVMVWVGLALSLRRRIVFPLQTISNVVAAMRHGDFSIRGRESSSPSDTLGELIIEVNALAQTLHEQRLGAVEATAVLRTVMEEIGVAVFAFDAGGRLKLLNRAAEHLLNMPAERALGLGAEKLGLEEYLDDASPRLVVDAAFPGGMGRWEIRRSVFRQDGKPHRLLVLSDLTRALREEELQAWQRIVRVIGHEINNSMTPIKSISGSLLNILASPNRSGDWEEDLTRGLGIIGSRSDGLARFMSAYARLARMPQPQRRPVEIGALVRHVASLETRCAVSIKTGPDVTIEIDPDQIEQALINIVQNAVDASLETAGTVFMSWTRSPGYIEVRVEDEGPGLSNTSNLFVPFFTTKPGGSGIGLVLSRQIAEAHGGSLRLENRNSSHGCMASLRLPL